MNENGRWITLKDGRRVFIKSTNEYMNDKIRNNKVPKINKEDNTDRRGGLNCNDLTVGGNINYYPDGLEKLPKRTSSDLTFYRRFIPYYVDNYLGRNINTRREYKIALYLYTVLNYYSSALDKEGWYGKLFPRHKYKGEEGKTLRKEVRDWLKANR